MLCLYFAELFDVLHFQLHAPKEERKKKKRKRHKSSMKRYTTTLWFIRRIECNERKFPMENAWLYFHKMEKTTKKTFKYISFAVYCTIRLHVNISSSTQLSSRFNARFSRFAINFFLVHLIQSSEMEKWNNKIAFAKKLFKRVPIKESHSKFEFV